MVYYWVYYILGDWEDDWELNTMVNMGFHVLCGRETFTVFLLFLLFVYIAHTTSETSALGHIQTL